MTGLVFGHYDPLHAGHVRLLRACRAQCDHLTVIVADGGKPGTPYFPLEDRLRDLRELRSVDLARGREGRSKGEWLRTIRPGILFVGEEETQEFAGVKVVRMPRTPGISSTMLRAAGR